MYTRKEILNNQKSFYNDIIKWFKKENQNAKKDLNDIDTDNEIIIKAKKNLQKKAKKAKIENGIKKLIISADNIYPNFYAWWDNENEEVLIFKYDKEKHETR